MGQDVLDQVREACAAVAARAAHVRIAEKRVAEYAASLSLTATDAPTLDPAHHYLGTPPETTAFVITLDTINFGSGYFPHLRKLPGLSGYFTVATALTECFHRDGPFTALQLARLTAADCAAVFGQDLANSPVAELMGLFTQALNDLGRYVGDRFDGDFIALVESGAGSAARLVEILGVMPFFQDVSTYCGQCVPLYKRAQLTAADLALALNGAGPGRFTDLNRLTIFADNLVPHVLRVDGILTYEPALAARIDAGELIPAGSEDEVEIRACAIHAVELMAMAVKDAGGDATPMRLDYLLWNRGQQPSYKALPRHRTRTVYY